MANPPNDVRVVFPEHCLTPHRSCYESSVQPTEAMKTICHTSVLLLGLTTLAFTGFSKAEQVEPAAGAPGAVPTSTETSARLKGYTFEQRAEFSLFVKQLGTQSDAAIAELNAGYTEMMATPARRAAMEALRRAAADFKDKTSALDNASAETWETIKSNLVTSWVNLQSALAKAREEKA